MSFSQNGVNNLLHRLYLYSLPLRPAEIIQFMALEHLTQNLVLIA